jgi:hypothetical protein
MKWSDIDMSFRPEDHPEIELFERNLPFVAKLSIGRHKVANTLVDNGASLNLIMRNNFIEMGINLSNLTQYMACSMVLSWDSRPLPLGTSISRYPVKWETTNAWRC